MIPTSIVSDSVSSNPVYLESQSPQTQESHTQSNTLNSSSQQHTLATSSTKRKVVKFTSTMEQELVKIANDNKTSSGVNWEGAFSSFKKTYPTYEISQDSLKVRYERLIESSRLGSTSGTEKKRKYTGYTEDMTRKLVQLVNTTKSKGKPSWTKITELFNEQFPESDVSVAALQNKFGRLTEDEKSNLAPESTSITSEQSEILDTHTTKSHDAESDVQPPIPHKSNTLPTSKNSDSVLSNPVSLESQSPQNYENHTQSNTLNSSSQQQTLATSSSRRKVVKFTSTMEQELVKIANDNKTSRGINWKGAFSSFKKTYPTCEISQDSLKVRYERLIESSRLGSTSGTEKKRKCIVYTEDMTRKLVQLVNTTTSKGKPSWTKITELFNEQFPESHLSEGALQRKFGRLTEDEKSNLAPESTSITSEQSEILDHTTNSHDAESDVQPQIPHNSNTMQGVTSTNALCMKRNKPGYTEEMLLALNELAHVTLQADGTPDWNKITIKFNERFPSVTRSKESLIVKYQRMLKVKQIDQTLGIRSKAIKYQTHRSFSREMEKELLRLGHEQLDQNKEINWQQIAKIFNSKYVLHKTENSYESMFNILNNSELTYSDHSDSEVSDIE